MLSSPAWCTWLNSHRRFGKPFLPQVAIRKGLGEKRLLPELREIRCRQSSVFRAFSGTLILLHRRKELQRIFTMRVTQPLKRSRGESSELHLQRFWRLRNSKTDNAAWAITPLQAQGWIIALHKYPPINISMTKRCFILLSDELMKLTEGHVFSLPFSDCFQRTHRCLQTSW